MNIIKGNVFRGYNYSKKQKALFDAMKSGKTIAKITLSEEYKKVRGNNEIINFKATDYYAAIQSNSNGIEFDYVDGSSDCEITTFYMSWVESFEL